MSTTVTIKHRCFSGINKIAIMITHIFVEKQTVVRAKLRFCLPSSSLLQI